MQVVPFYDNLPATVAKEDPAMVEVERIYCLDSARFEAADWSRLDSIYRGLPGHYREKGGPMWFGDDEDRPPFLWASVEPPGVQVYGVLSPAAWAEWDQAFMAALSASELPVRVGRRS